MTCLRENEHDALVAFENSLIGSPHVADILGFWLPFFSSPSPIMDYTYTYSFLYPPKHFVSLHQTTDLGDKDVRLSILSPEFTILFSTFLSISSSFHSNSKAPVVLSPVKVKTPNSKSTPVL